jgi:hypothetical protein
MDSQILSLALDTQSLGLRVFQDFSAERKPKHKRHSRQRLKGIVVSNKLLAIRARDGYAGLWTLEACHAGEISLKFNEQEVAFLAQKLGLAMLRAEACPFIRAADVITALISGLAIVVSDQVRAKLEFGLTRWIPLYFNL